MQIIAKNSDYNDKKIIFISDNAAVHTSEEVDKFISKSGLRLLTIFLYRTSMNPVEKVVEWIKAKIGLLQCSQK